MALNASLLPVEGGGPRAEAKVEGVADSLPQLVDRLIAQLITEEAGAPHGLDGLVNRPLPALRLYLEAQAAYRRADYADAVARLEQALDLDSTFAIAGLRLASAAGWTAAPGAARRGLERAWSQSRPAEPARPGIADGRSGSGLSGGLHRWRSIWPGGNAPWTSPPTSRSGGTSWATCTSTRVSTCRSSPPAGGRRRPSAGRWRWTRARAPLGHLIEVAVLDDDSATVRRLGALYLARDSSGELLGFYRWRIAEGLHDEPALAALRAQYRQMPLPSLWRIMNYAVLDGRRMEDAESAAVAIRATAGRSSDWQRSKTYLHAFEINRGHPAKALGDTARLG